MEYEGRRRSRWWYLLPILFTIFGGLISFFAIRHDDPKKARNCLIVGIVLAAIPFIIPILMLATIPDYSIEEEWVYQIGKDNLGWV